MPSYTSRPHPEGVTTESIRKWGLEQGLLTKGKGRIPNSVVDAYYAAHGLVRSDPVPSGNIYGANRLRFRADGLAAPKLIRQWAKKQGFITADQEMGPVPEFAVQAYYAAHNLPPPVFEKPIKVRSTPASEARRAREAEEAEQARAAAEAERATLVEAELSSEEVDSADQPPAAQNGASRIQTTGGGVTIYTVTSPTGTAVRLQTKDESRWYRDQRDKYLAQNHFVNISDLQDLDRLLTLEVMVHRWSSWLTQGFDHQGRPVEPHILKSNIAEYSKEIRAVKAALGIDRVTRDKDKGESVGDYLSNLLLRAKEFGVHRNKEYEHAVTFLWELISRIQTYDRCDDIERRDLNLNPETIIGWVRDEVMPEWNALSVSFQEQQKIWIREL